MKKAQTVISTVLCAINAYLMGFYSGFDRGYEKGLELLKECRVLNFSGGPSYLAEMHFALTICFVILLIGLQIHREVVSRIICILSLLLALFFYFRWIGLMILNSELTFLENLNNTTDFLDWVSLALVLILMIQQMVIIVKSKYSATG